VMLRLDDFSTVLVFCLLLPTFIIHTEDFDLLRVYSQPCCDDDDRRSMILSAMSPYHNRLRWNKGTVRKSTPTVGDLCTETLLDSLPVLVVIVL
jgi:hypothetical protein